MSRLLTALFTALMLLLNALPASAQEGFSRTFGGNGEDALPYMISAGGGLLAAGHTTSTDGDLSMRKRTGKAGWLLRLDEKGNTLWSVVSAHVGRSEMRCPFAHADGTFSAVLTGENEGSEWLRVSEKGKITARIQAPEAKDACAHGGAKACWAMPFERRGEPLLALMVTHEDGTGCCSVMNEAGTVTKGAPVFSLLPDSALAVCRDGEGFIAAVNPLDGDAQILFIEPGEQQSVRSAIVPVDAGKLQIVLCVVPCEDGSVIFSGQLAAIGSLVMRVSAQGETIFVVTDCGNYAHMTLTNSGFAGAGDGQIVFYDEDGANLGSVAYEQSGWLSSIAALGDGAAVMESSFEAVRKPVKVTALPAYAPAFEEEYPGAVYTRAMSTLESAHVDGAHIALDVCDRYGERFRIKTDARGAQLSIVPAEKNDRAQAFSLPSGELTFEEKAPGARVTLRDAQGGVRFETATPIHTAADRVQWLCAAQMPDGSILLGGRYLTKIIPNTQEKQMKLEMTRDGFMQEGVIARLGANGVLQDVAIMEDYGCVAAIAPGSSQADTLLLCARGDMTNSVLSSAVTLDRRAQGVLDIFLEPSNAHLLTMEDGVYAAGTSKKNGRSTVVVQPVNVREEKASKPETAERP